MAVFHQVAMPSQHCVWADQEPESAQSCAGQWREECGEERSILGSELWALVAELSL